MGIDSLGRDLFRRWTTAKHKWFGVFVLLLFADFLIHLLLGIAEFVELLEKIHLAWLLRIPVSGLWIYVAVMFIICAAISWRQNRQPDDGSWMTVLKPIPIEKSNNIETTPQIGDDGVKRVLKMHIMRGHEILRADEVTREGFPGVGYMVERVSADQNQPPKYVITPNQNEANATWWKWYKEWKAMPGGFGGASGTGLDGKPPW